MTLNQTVGNVLLMLGLLFTPPLFVALFSGVVQSGGKGVKRAVDYYRDTSPVKFWFFWTIYLFMAVVSTCAGIQLVSGNWTGLAPKYRLVAAKTTDTIGYVVLGLAAIGFIRFIRVLVTGVFDYAPPEAGKGKTPKSFLRSTQPRLFWLSCAMLAVMLATMAFFGMYFLRGT